MFNGKKVVVVMPAYNAANTLRRTYDEVMAQGVVDEIVLVDDCSTDDTVKIAESLAHTRVHRHDAGAQACLPGIPGRRIFHSYHPRQYRIANR